MASNLFWGWSEADLLAALRRAQEDYQRGVMLIGSGAGDVNATMMIQKTAQERIERIQVGLYELNATTYAGFSMAGQSQTVGNFTQRS